MASIKIQNTFKSIPIDANGLAGIKFTMPVNIRDFIASASIVLNCHEMGLTLADTWFPYFNDRFWTATRGSWDGTQWVSPTGDFEYIELVPNGGWEVGFLPSRIDLSFDTDTPGENVSIRLDSINDGPTIINQSTGTSPFLGDLTFTRGIGGQEILWDLYSLTTGSSARINPHIGFSTEYRPTVPVTPYYLEDIAVDDSRNVYLSNREQQKVERYAPDGTQTGTLTFSRYVWGVAWYNNDLYTLESTSQSYPVSNLYIVRYSGFSTTFIEELSIGTPFYRPRSLTFSSITGRPLVSGSVGSSTYNNHIIEYLGWSTTINQNIDHSALEADATGAWIAVNRFNNLIVSAYNVACIEYNGISTTEINRCMDRYGDEAYFSRGPIAAALPLESEYSSNLRYDQIESLRVTVNALSTVRITDIKLEYIPPPAGGWIQKFDDTFWSVLAGGSWDGTKWVLTDNFALTPIGGWQIGYRPTGIRVSYSTNIVDDINVSLMDGVGPTVMVTYTQPTGWEETGFTLTDDIAYFILEGPSKGGFTAGEITNIEFFEE